MRIWILAAMLALSGCLSDNSDNPDVVDDEVPDTTSNETAEFKITKGVGSITAAAGPLAIGTGGTPFTVQPGATLLYVELRWSDPVQDIDLGVASPSAGTIGGTPNYDNTVTGGAPGAPDSPHSFTLANPEAGDWSMTAFANIVSAQIDFEMAATVFYGASSVPEGHTGF